MPLAVPLPLQLPPKIADPSNPASVGVASAASHDLQALDAPVLARVTRTADQSIPSGGPRTTNILVWDGIDTDDYGMWSAARPERLTILVDGWYVGALTVGFAASAPAAFDEEIGLYATRIDGTQPFLLLDARPSPTDTTLARLMTTVSPARYLGAGDYVLAFAWQNSGSAVAVSGTTGLPTSFELRRVGGRAMHPNTIDALTGGLADALAGTALDAMQGG